MPWASYQMKKNNMLEIDILSIQNHKKLRGDLWEFDKDTLLVKTMFLLAQQQRQVARPISRGHRTVGCFIIWAQLMIATAQYCLRVMVFLKPRPMGLVVSHFNYPSASPAGPIGPNIRLPLQQSSQVTLLI